MKMAHGGDRYRNRIRTDFSVNLNPLDIPEVLQDALQRGITNVKYYPDILQDEERKAAALFYGGRFKCTPDPEWMIPGNGASELIQTVIRELRPRRVLLPVPCFTGYLRAVTEAADAVDFYETKKECGYQPDAAFGMELKADTELLILTNPGNPSGRLLDRELLLQLLRITRERKIPVLLDECFLEFTGQEERSMIPYLAEYPNLMVLRAFTKIFALPGLRLGVLMTADPLLGRRIRLALPEWNLSSFATEVLVTAAKEREALYTFLDRTAEYVRKERSRMTGQLLELGFPVQASDANFFLTDGPGELSEELKARGILIRTCEDMEPLDRTMVRLAVRPEEEQQTLWKAIREIREKKPLLKKIF